MLKLKTGSNIRSDTLTRDPIRPGQNRWPGDLVTRDPVPSLQQWQKSAKFLLFCCVFVRLFSVYFVPVFHFYASVTVRRCHVSMWSVRARARPFIRQSVLLFPRYLWFALMDFHRTSVSSALWQKDELITFWGQRSKVKVTAWPNMIKIPFSRFVSTTTISPASIDGFSSNFCQ